MAHQHQSESYADSWVLEGTTDGRICDMTMLQYKSSRTLCLCVNGVGYMVAADAPNRGTRFEIALRDKVLRDNTPEDRLIEDIVDHVLIWDKA
jgi:hypothetical protein